MMLFTMLLNNLFIITYYKSKEWYQICFFSLLRKSQSWSHDSWPIDKTKLPAGIFRQLY